MKKQKYIIAISIIAVLLTTFYESKNIISGKISPKLSSAQSTDFNYVFGTNETLVETGKMIESPSPYFWLNSGGMLVIRDGVGNTIQGGLDRDNKWRILYNKSSPNDTQYGYYPQNLFRLFTKQKWGDAIHEVYFKVNKTNLTETSSRNESNGVLILQRYLDSQDTYYSGLRTDGSFIVKKKREGKYYTLLEVPKVYSGQYNKYTNPNLIPLNTWIGIRSIIKNDSLGNVSLTVYIDKENRGEWLLLGSVLDDGTIGGKPITQDGFSGLRTDFMDVSFDNFRIVGIRE